MLQISFSTQNNSEHSHSQEEALIKGALAILVFESEEESLVFHGVNKAIADSLTRAAKAEAFTGKEGTHCVILAPVSHLSRVVLIGVGKKEAFQTWEAEKAGGYAASLLGKEKEASLITGCISGALAAHVALGAVLGAYHFSAYRNEAEVLKNHKLIKLSIVASSVDEADKAKALWPSLVAVAQGVALTRDVVSEPANVLTPIEFADRISNLRCHGLEVEVFDRPAMEKLGFGALLGVAQGSVNEPRMVVMRWNGGKKDDSPLAFVGKGVTFDSGGVSLKPAAGMEEMKWDMAGAGAVVGLMAALALRKAKVNAVGLVGLVENMVSGKAQRPGDIVKSASGKTIEVLNTDAEGRLVLADVLDYACKNFAPKLVVDLATLTGAIVVSLGHEYAGLFSNNDTLAHALETAGLQTGEKLWRLPLDKEYDKLLNSDIADIQNISSGRDAGSITAAQFLKRFIGETSWAHLDIAGVAWAKKSRHGQPKGATGFGVRLLDCFVREGFEK